MGRITDYETLSAEKLRTIIEKVVETYEESFNIVDMNKRDKETTNIDDLKTWLILLESDLLVQQNNKREEITENISNIIREVKFS